MSDKSVKPESRTTELTKHSVLHVCKVFLPVRGGVQIVVSRIQGSVNKHFNHHVLATTPEKNSNQNNTNESVTLVHAYAEIFSMPIAPKLISELWKKSRSCDLLAIHYPFPLADLAVTLGFFRKLPPIVVYWHSEIISQKLSSLLVRPLTHIMLRRARSIIVSSPNLIQHSAILRKYEEKCKVIPFGYLPKKPHTDVTDGGYFLFVGRHVPYKGIDVLIRAAAISKVNIKIAGNGPLLTDHQELAKTLGVEQSVEFLKGNSDDEIEMLLSNCKALVLPSVLASEAFALVQIEAMCFGKPVVNTNLPSGVPWVARHEKEGLTVEPQDINGLSDALTLLQKDESLLKSLGAGAKERWRQLFSIEVFANMTKSTYFEHIDQNHHRTQK